MLTTRWSYELTEMRRKPRFRYLSTTIVLFPLFATKPTSVFTELNELEVNQVRGGTFGLKPITAPVMSYEDNHCQRTPMRAGASSARFEMDMCRAPRALLCIDAAIYPSSGITNCSCRHF